MKKIILAAILTIAFTVNAFAQWIRVDGLNIFSLKDIIYVNSTFFVCSQGQGVYSSSDEGVTWQVRNTGLANTDSKRSQDIELIDGKLYLATVDGIYVSSDMGEIWERKSNGFTIGPGANNVFAYSIFENNGILISGAHNGLYYSTDSGNNWQISNISGSHNDVVAFINFHGVLFAGRDSGLMPPAYRSTDGGMLWEPVNIFNNSAVSSFCFFSEEDTLFAGGLGMYVSANNGQTWTERSNGLSPDPYVSSIAKSGNTMIASLKFGGSGMYKTTDNGFNWVSIEDNLPFLNEISKILIHDNFLFITTSNGIWKRPLNEILTGINSSTGGIPSGFYMSQNYPNPFNPVTNLEFGISELGFVSLKVYSSAGKEVAVLVNENKPAGKYSVRFDGSKLASGVYYYILKTGNFYETKKMVILK